METTAPTSYIPSLTFISVARFVGFTVLLFALNRLVPLGSSPWFLGFCMGVGVWLSYKATRACLSQKKFFLVLVLGCLAVEALYAGFYGIYSAVFGHSLGEYSLSLHANLGLAALVTGLVTTWAFWTVRGYATAEAILVFLIALQFFAGHRDFNFQLPKILGTLAWQFRTTELWTLAGIGGGLMLFLLAYCFASSEALVYRQSRYVGLVREKVSVTRKLFRLALPLSLLLIILGGISYGIHSVYFREAEVRLANGVGQKDSEKASPLSFESAIGASAQPAAIVRLDADYKDNPFVPMMYLREAALSKFDGHEMVSAGNSFDRDVPNIPPEAAFERQDIKVNEYRTPLRHSVFLLGEHKLAFAVDTPLTITPLKNPKPDRFKGAYKAYSMAPAYGPMTLKDHAVGDPNWSEAEKLLYSEAHPDKRYEELARKIVGTETNPIVQAQMLVEYLNKNTIYTLQPKHDVEKSADQTAPYLFGDMRGYCVHFAHAMTYLLRSLHIPARVSTGYLTDLSQAQDGHILLRMSDRHAWPEVFVTDIGWIPFDIKPEKVESHAESPIDMKLLQELMGMLGPDEEVLPKETKDDPALAPPEKETNVNPTVIVALLAGSILVLLLVRLWTLYSYLLTSKTQSKIQRGYRALLARLAAEGMRKSQLETKREFQRRVEEKLAVRFLILTDDIEHMLYSKEQNATQDWAEKLGSDFKTWRSLGILKELKAIVYPARL